MRNMMTILAAAGLAGCGSATETPQANETAAKQEKEKPAYCFFKEDGTKDWKASTDKDGNVVVSGKAYREDGRYKAVLGEATVSGDRAEVRPSITPNPSYASVDGWWDVSAVIPDSSAVTKVAVRCGKRTLADLEVARKS